MTVPTHRMQSPESKVMSWSADPPAYEMVGFVLSIGDLMIQTSVWWFKLQSDETEY